MKVFIPELGAKLKLKKDWKFKLYPERRNTTLGKYFGLVENQKIPWTQKFTGKTFNTKVDLWKDLTHLVTYKDEIRQESPTAVGDVFDWNGRQYIGGGDFYYTPPNKPYDVILPKDHELELVVDRIYIRKGAEEFSSVTFKFVCFGKTYRFWVKLEDANNLVVEPVCPIL